MFTTGSKFLLGLTFASAVALVLYGITQDWGALGTVGLASAMVVLGMLAGIVVYTRDADVAADDPAVAPAAIGAPSRSMWPLIGAVGAVLITVGLVTSQPVFVLGLVVVIATFVEWVVQAWSDRASTDGSYNAEARGRLLHPLEFPILAAVGLGLVAVAFSRVMLTVSKSAGAIIFIVVATLVLVFGFLFSSSRKASVGVIAGICTVGALGLVAGGVAAALQGERDELVEAYEEGHYTEKHCTEKKDKYFDKKALKHVSSKAGAFATVTLEGGKLTAEVNPLGPVDTITIQRSNPSDIIFVNRDPEERRLTADLGTRAVTDADGNAVEGPDGAVLREPVEDCTQLMGQDNFSMLTLRIPKPSDPAAPYRLFVPGVDGAEIVIVVP
jgi:hypothetical protein